MPASPFLPQNRGGSQPVIESSAKESTIGKTFLLCKKIQGFGGKPCGTRPDKAAAFSGQGQKKPQSPLRSWRLTEEDRLFLPVSLLPPVRSRSSVFPPGRDEYRFHSGSKVRSKSFLFWPYFYLSRPGQYSLRMVFNFPTISRVSSNWESFVIFSGIGIRSSRGSLKSARPEMRADHA